jgi:hypothetical protein
MIGSPLVVPSAPEMGAVAAAGKGLADISECGVVHIGMLERSDLAHAHPRMGVLSDRDSEWVFCMGFVA